MNTNFTKLKMQDAIKTIQNNDLCTLTLCENGSPFCTPIIYDSDCYCGNIKLTFETCVDGKLSELIENDNNCCCQLTNRCNNKIEVITMESAAANFLMSTKRDTPVLSQTRPVGQRLLAAMVIVNTPASLVSSNIKFCINLMLWHSTPASTTSL